MLFTKFIAPFVAFMSIGVAFASLVAEPAPAAVEARELKSREIEARQLNDILGIVSGLESSIAPILTSLSKYYENISAVSRCSLTSDDFVCSLCCGIWSRYHRYYW